MFRTVLIANRGAIAVRIIRTLRRLGISPVVVYTKADADSLHVRLADHAECIGDGPAADSYLDIDKILAVAKKYGAGAIHPGYGFLSENTAFAAACAAAGIAFVGPRPEHVRAFGLKHTARELAQQNGIPLSPGTGLLDTPDAALAAAGRIGYPVMLKSTAGGGGIGMQVCRNDAGLSGAFASVQRLSQNNFGNAGLFVEKYIEHARHIEVQVFGDGRGGVIALGERDCSLQRRNQKVIEETPAPGLDDATRQALHETATRLCAAVNYANAGTVEFIYDAQTRQFYFLEVNTRLQVEHGVTELVTGIDIVELMLKEAAGELPPLSSIRVQPRGHAVQARLYAEDPGKDFQPQSGLLTHVAFPPADNVEVRIDRWIEAGVTVPPFYDPMLAKVMVCAPDRATALARLGTVLDETVLAGIETNRDYLRQMARDPVLAAGDMTTRYLGTLDFRSAAIDVLDGGTMTTVQDHPGRTGFWDVGVPPSGPFDSLAFRLGNRLLGNDERAAGLEITLNGPALKFRRATTVVLTGAGLPATLDDVPVPYWATLPVPAGGVLRIGRAGTTGARAFLCVAGGIEVPDYLGSKSTFTLGQFGGHGGRALRVGDVLHLAENAAAVVPAVLPVALRPVCSNDWTLRVQYGPHGAPDFFTDGDIDTFFATAWEVHYNSSRTGVRLLGPKPQWARPDGGEAGLHPSNIHDNAYAIGAVDFTGDMPVILGPDGPSLGGFVCPAVVVTADRWKLGQLRPGDRVTFLPVAPEIAVALEEQQDELVRTLAQPDAVRVDAIRAPAIVRALPAGTHATGVTYRVAGDKYLLVEYGPLQLDISLRFRVHALWQWLKAAGIAGIVDLTPGIRSLQVHYDSRVLPRAKLLDILAHAERELADVDDMAVSSRTVWLPLSWDDPQTRLAIEKYMQSVRKDAPWCPSNIEFIRRINGLDSIGDVQKIVFDAEYLVMGLGDVYLGAPVATPLDPRHRLVTTKYNPARTWTPENAVGIGGSYMCVYGMEGPGGYQFVGRTVQMWNRWRKTPEFGQPWLLRFFDKVRFYPVSAEELLDMREAFPRGDLRLKIEEGTFRLRDYNRFLSEQGDSIAAFKQRQQSAFEAERERWRNAGHGDLMLPLEAETGTDTEVTVADNEVLIQSHVPGSVWQLAARPGDEIAAGMPVVVVESMKMEIPVASPQRLRLKKVLVAPGAQVQPGTVLAIGECLE
ncbi:MAG: urea carboxylase [Pseudomonadota bacterium]